MPISKDLIRQIRTLDTYDLRRLLMLIRGLLLEDPPERSQAGAVTFRQEMVKCGKAGCTRCPHGPYWYAYWREDGRTRSRYVGKHLPAGSGEGETGG
jgi:hypothetical protein